MNNFSTQILTIDGAIEALSKLLDYGYKYGRLYDVYGRSHTFNISYCINILISKPNNIRNRTIKASCIVGCNLSTYIKYKLPIIKQVE